MQKQNIGWKKGDVRKSVNLYVICKYNIFSQVQPRQNSFKKTSTNLREFVEDVLNKHNNVMSYLPMDTAYKKISS